MNQCPICLKQLSSKKSYDYHISHKVCQNRRQYICYQCHTEFSSKQVLDYHIQKSVCQRKPKIILKVKDYESMTKQQLLSEINQLKGENKALKENPQTISNNQINIVVPPAFLEIDNYEILSKKLPHLLHEALSHHPNNFISYLIKETNCNPQRPIYNSIKLTSHKSPLVQVSDGDQYVYASKKKTIDELIQNKKDILQEYVDQNGEKYGKKILSRYETYLKTLDVDKNSQKELEIDIIIMLLNMSKVIGLDDWSRKLLNDLKSFDDSPKIN